MKRIFTDYSESSQTHIKFATGLTGEEVQAYFDEESDRIRTQANEEPVYCEMDVSSMDACRNHLLREIEVIIFNEIGYGILDQMGISTVAIETIADNIKKIDNSFSIAEYTKEGRIVHCEGTLTGTTLSGWPFQTTFANTITMITFG